MVRWCSWARIFSIAEKDLKAFTTSFSTVAVAPPSLLDPRPGDGNGGALEGDNFDGVRAETALSVDFEVEIGAGTFGLSVFSEFEGIGLLFSLAAALVLEEA
jgi:hypothetical protein